MSNECYELLIKFDGDDVWTSYGYYTPLDLANECLKLGHSMSCFQIDVKKVTISY